MFFFLFLAPKTIFWDRVECYLTYFIMFEGWNQGKLKIIVRQWRFRGELEIWLHPTW